MLKAFGIQYPIIQAPMAGVTTPKLVAACAEAGILGSIGAGYLDGSQTQSFIQEVKRLTTNPFAVNLFVQEEPHIDVKNLQQARMELEPFYEELHIPKIQRVISNEVFEGQVQAVLDEHVPICTFTFGLPDALVISRLKANHVYLIGTATTLAEAKRVEEMGLDAVVLQGSEAGGHRGYFIEPMQLITREELLMQVINEISIPVISAGGIATKEDVQQALAAGATAVQIGTSFILAKECEVSETYKNAILHSGKKGTTITRAFTGKPARGLVNEFTERMKDAVVAPYPLQHHLTTAIRRESAISNKAEYLSLWMGESSHLAKEGTVEEIVATLI